MEDRLLKLNKYYQKLSNRLNKIDNKNGGGFDIYNELIDILYNALYPYLFFENRFSYVCGRDEQRIGFAFWTLINISLLPVYRNQVRNCEVDGTAANALPDLNHTMHAVKTLVDIEVGNDGVNRRSFFYYIASVAKLYPELFMSYKKDIQDLSFSSNTIQYGFETIGGPLWCLLLYLREMVRLYEDRVGSLPRCYYVEGHNLLSHQVLCPINHPNDTGVYCGVGHLNRLVLDLAKLMVKQVMGRVISSKQWWKSYVDVRELETMAVGLSMSRSPELGKEGGDDSFPCLLDSTRGKIIESYIKLIRQIN